MKKQVVVIGMGRFGSNLAQELYQMGNDVLAIDSDERKVQEMLGQVTYMVKADATNESVLKELSISDYDVAIIAIGTDIQTNMLVTVLLKSFGIPFIVSRANNRLHGATLERIGADKVVYPEHEAGHRIAHMEFNPGLLDYMEVVGDFGISKLRPPDHMVKSTIEEAGLSGPRDKYGIAVMAIRRGREYILIPAKDEEIRPGDILIVAGKTDQIGRVHSASKEMSQSNGSAAQERKKTK